MKEWVESTPESVRRALINLQIEPHSETIQVVLEGFIFDIIRDRRGGVRLVRDGRRLFLEVQSRSGQWSRLDLDVKFQDIREGSDL